MTESSEFVPIIDGLMKYFIGWLGMGNMFFSHVLRLKMPHALCRIIAELAGVSPHILIVTFVTMIPQ